MSHMSDMHLKVTTAPHNNTPDMFVIGVTLLVNYASPENKNRK
jgi:hypothetical protein